MRVRGVVDFAFGFERREREREVKNEPNRKQRRIMKDGKQVGVRKAEGTKDLRDDVNELGWVWGRMGFER